MTDKTALRKLYKSVRNSFNNYEKSLIDEKIFTQFINSDLYKNSISLLIYVSSKGETDTFNIINYALANGKSVAVPYCEDEMMIFYNINSLDDLREGAFGIPEPDPKKCTAVCDFSDAVCIVPALSFDFFGNRLGYGGGYYDRFLSENSVITVGLCRERSLCPCLPSEEHDIAIDYILTENGLRNSKKEVSE